MRVSNIGGFDGFGELGFVPLGDAEHWEAWEVEIFGLVFAARRNEFCTTDQWRDAVERLAPDVYLSTSYYERWVLALESLFANDTFGDNVAGRPMPTPEADSHLGSHHNHHEKHAPYFPLGPPEHVGSVVTVKPAPGAGHDRTPHYLHGHVGQIFDARHPAPWPTDAVGNTSTPATWVYCVRFDRKDVFLDTDCAGFLFVEMWEADLFFNRE